MDELYSVQNGEAIEHYGTPRHSGRYPWGSGENPYQRDGSFLKQYTEYHESGYSDKEIAKMMGITTSQLRTRRSIERDAERRYLQEEARRLKDKGLSNVAIGERMGGVSESTVRGWLEPSANERAMITANTADILRSNVEDKKYIDIGKGVENHLGVSKDKLNTAVEMLRQEGYEVINVQVDQLGTGPGKKTTIKVLCPPGTTYQELKEHKDEIRMIHERSEDGGRTFLGLEPPVAVDPKRIDIVYAEDGGTEKDGVIELRRGVDDISLGNANYAQVRINVDGTHYLKGMAMYSDDLPEGIDIRFNTNKHKGTPMLGKEGESSVLKPMKTKKDGSIDMDNPFGATIKREEDLYLCQKHYIDKDGNKQLSALNVVTEEGNWANWGKTLSSQLLSKQAPKLAERQLKLLYDGKEQEFNDILSVTNPTVKRKLLDAFADNCDSAAVHLEAAGMPRQQWHVILPIPSIKENEIFAPNYENGEKVVLIRYPHGGKFEIPELVVNNKNKDALRLIGPNAKDAVGINHKVAEQLSGADFDGDTVIVIPNNKGDIKTRRPFEQLQDFDPKEAYKAYPGMPKMTNKQKQNEMGKVSNLITDMTIKGAKDDEIVRAVRHSMVVIDAEKHNLNYKQSYIDNGIAELKVKYQGGTLTNPKGASTLISRASSEQRVDKTKEWRRKDIDPETGEKIFRPDPKATYTKTYFRKDGKNVNAKIIDIQGDNVKVKYSEGGKERIDILPKDKVKQKQVTRQMVSTKMAQTNDARTLSSGTKIEEAYAEHANKLKALANRARKESYFTPSLKYDPKAKQVYAQEVSSLMFKLNESLKKQPYERQAQLLANKIFEAKKYDNPGMDNATAKKIKNQALVEARSRVTPPDRQKVLDITDREWEAIQAGAITESKLSQILDYADLDVLRERSTPRNKVGLTNAQEARIKALSSSGYTTKEIADAVGVSTSSVQKALS